MSIQRLTSADNSYALCDCLYCVVLSIQLGWVCQGLSKLQLNLEMEVLFIHQLSACVMPFSETDTSDVIRD